jgi:hypothetical protein
VQPPAPGHSYLETMTATAYPTKFPTTPSQHQQLEMLDLCQDILDYIESKEPYFERREDAPEIWLKLWELRGNISGWNLR